MVYSAADMFSILEVHGDIPFNIKFQVRNSHFLDLPKRIIYTILFDDEPIYIGYSMNAKQKDIRKTRWTKQLETILFRGYRVGINKKVYLKVKSSIQLKLDRKYHSRIKIRKTDTMTSSNRIDFATKYWDEIIHMNEKNDNFLKRFTFRIEDSKDLNKKEDIKRRVKALIEKNTPICNG